MIAKFLWSYHTAFSCTILENYKYDLEHLTEVNAFLISYTLYIPNIAFKNINLSLNKKDHNES